MSITRDASVPPTVPREGGRWRYDAFLSYRRKPDEAVAAVLQRELQRFAKPFYKRRVLRLFRDTTTVPLTEEVWPPIQKALAESEHLLLLASPAAAQSEWVQQEVEEWMRLHEGTTENLLILLTDGEILWDTPRRQFDWMRTTALPRVLDGAYGSLPNYIDMRWARTSQDLSTRNPLFLDAVATVASALRGIPKDDLVGTDVREHRRFVWARNIAGAALLLLTMGLVQATRTAVEQFQLARSQLEGTYVANGAAQIESGRPALAMPWYVQALSIASDRPWYRQPFSPSRYNTKRRSTHQFRLAAILGQIPVPVQIWAPEDRVAAAYLTSEDRQVAVLTDGARNFDYEESRWKCGRPGEPRCRGALQVFDAASGTQVASAVYPDHIVASAVARSGTLLATVAVDGTVRVWSLPAARQLWSRAILPAESGLASVAFSADGNRLVVSAGASPVVWHLRTRTPIEAPAVLRDMVYVGSDASARWYAFTDEERAVVWDMDQGGIRPLPLPPGFQPHGIGAMSPDGQVAALGGTISRPLPPGTFGTAERYILALVNVRRGTRTRLLDHPWPVTSVTFDASGERVLTTSGVAPEGGSNDGGARLWNVSDGRLLADGMERPPLSSATLGPDGHTVVVASEDGTATLWAPPETMDETGSALQTVLEHGSAVTGAELLRDGRRMLTVDESNQVRLWLLPPSEQEAEFGSFQAAPKDLLRRSERMLRARIGPRKPGGEMRLLALMPHDDSAVDTLQHARLSEDGKLAVTWEVGSPAVVWSTRTGRPVMESPITHPGGVLSATISPDGRWVATGGFDHTARLWDSRTGKATTRALRHPGVGSQGQVNVYFIGRGERLVTVDWTDARMWDVASGELLGPPFEVGIVDEHAPVDTLLASSGLVEFWPGVISWPAEDFQALAELAAGHRIDSVGNLVPLDIMEIRDRWRRVHALRAAGPSSVNVRGTAAGRREAPRD